ncbi:MAG: O-antigen ligase family protein [Chloroflexi bacterium]|nr:O-antigen ligase family protein [Chloroflexota bacterium]
MVTKSLLGVAKRLVRHELAVLLVSAPLLLFPSPLSAIPLVAIIAVWFSRWFATGHVTRRTGLELPILAIVFLLPVSVLTSIDPKLSLPKLLGLLLGVACFYGIVNASHFEKRIPALAGLISAAGVFVSVAGALGMARAEKLMPLWSLQSGLAVFRGGADVLERAFNPNEVGGTLAMLIPFALSIVVFSKERRVRIVTGASLGMMLPTLVFTQSRWAFVTTAVVSLCVLALRNRRVWLVFPTGAIAAVGFAWLAGPTRLLESLDYLGSTGSAAGRVEIWQRAFYVIQDFPLTGVGLNTFVPVTQRLYPYFLVPNYNFGHAHNIFLQLALDLGLPGLAAGIGLFASLIYVWKGGLPSVRGKRLEGAYVGFMALISAYLIFGLLDAIAFGAKPSVLVWAAAGGIVATRIGVESQERPEDVRPVRARGIRWSLSRAGKVALSAASVLGLALALYGTPLAVGTFYRNLGNVQLAKAVLGNDSGAMASSENLLQRSHFGLARSFQ